MSEYQVLRLVRERDAARAEVANLQTQLLVAESATLADLRAKVEALPLQVVNMQAVPGQPDDFREAVLLVDVLALFKEVPK